MECENLPAYHNHQMEYIQDLSRKQCIYDIDTLQVNVLYNDQLDNQFFMDIDGKILKLVANVDEEEQEVNNASFDFQDNETLTNGVYDAQAPDGAVKNYQMVYVHNDNSATRYLSSAVGRQNEFKAKRQENNQLLRGDPL